MMSINKTTLRIAALIPCYNEAAAIRSVVLAFKEYLPEATIYVFDNNSSDETAKVARAAGAEVFHEVRQGKGNVVNEMFRRVDADIYVMIDGDGTYDVGQVRNLIEPVINQKFDMVCATRLGEYDKASFRALHVFGNNLILKTINVLFRSQLSDILTGYRVFSRRFVKTFPALSKGFEIETEMTLHALDRNLKLLEMPAKYGVRADGSESKLNTYSDGFRVIRTIFRIFRHYKPMLFFSFIAAMFAIAGLAAGFLPVKEFIETGLIYRIPSIVLASGLMLLSALSFCIGLVLDTISQNQRELFQWHFAQATDIPLRADKYNADSSRVH